MYGGRPSDLAAHTDLPFTPEARQQWDKAVGTRPVEDLISIQATEIGTLYMNIPGDKEIQSVGQTLRNALQFILNRRTTIRFQKQTH